MEAAKINFKDVAIGALIVAVIWLASASGFFSGGIHQESGNSSDAIFSVASSTGDTYFTVAANGNVGVNNQVPATALDVYGMIRTYSGAQTMIPCTTALAGTIQFSGYYQHFYGCNGGKWLQLDSQK